MKVRNVEGVKVRWVASGFLESRTPIRSESTVTSTHCPPELELWLLLRHGPTGKPCLTFVVISAVRIEASG